MNNPYRIPDDGRHRTLNISGGRSSGYMLRNILDAHNGALPPNTTAIFCNTGREMPETLDFMNKIQMLWNVPIVWLEYHLQDERPKHHYRIVNHNSASRDGEPFEAMLQAKGMLPNVKMRFCTSELKVRTVERYVRRHLGLNPKHSISVLGIRYDEPRRWEPALMGVCNSEFPMVHAKVQKADVLNYWYGKSPFNLTIDSMFGNCDLCFMKGKKRKLTILRQRPDLADWWIKQEQKIPRKREIDAMAKFVKGGTVQQLLEQAKQPQFWDPEDDDIGVDCFCTD